MKFGYFDDKNKEYVITTPRTPFPWINYLGNQDFYGLVSNTAGGYCFYKDAKMRRLIRYRYNNVPIDMGGRYFYINDSDDIWSPGWMPVKKDLSSYECRHGLGYTSITSTRNDLTVDQTMFIPLNTCAEIYKVKLTNQSSTTKSVKLFSYLEFCLWNAQDDMSNFQRNLSCGEVEVLDSTIYHKTEYRERRDHYSFYHVNAPINGFDTDRESFLGMYNGPDTPEAVINGNSKNTIAHGWSPIASHQLTVTLNPGESKDYVFILGYIENPENEKWEQPNIINKTRAKEMIARFDSSEKADAALKELNQYWENLLEIYSVNSGIDKLDRMVNIWNQYQCMVTFNMSRSASYFESGIGRGMGFRDSNQDLLGFVHLVPERARERILDIASTQLEDGSAYHQYQPLTKKGNHEIGGGFNDDPLWLILGTVAYIKESGDFGILDEQVPFDCDASKADTLLEHLRRSFNFTINNLGPHNLPLIGRADWNDCLNLNCFSKNPNESFQTCGNTEGRVAESVFIAGMFVYIGKMYVEVLTKKGLTQEAAEATKHIQEMEKTVLKHGYDENWFLRAYDSFGEKVGSQENEEGKIFIEPQGFCVMAGIGVNEGLAERALDSVKEYLNTPYGIVLQEPPYSTYQLNLGEISTYPPGYKENGGIFCHNNPWIACAETVLGRGNRAYEYYSQISPAFTENISEIHKMEPYVYSQMIAGKHAAIPGEAKNSWLTGTAAWNFALISQWILGIKPELEGLAIDPCIPEAWDGFEINRKFRGTTYAITVKNPHHICKGTCEISVDGTKIKGNILPLFSDNNTHQVEVILTPDSEQEKTTKRTVTANAN